MNQSVKPVSEIIKSREPEDEPKKRSREEWRKAKELEEMRKAGTAPAAVDEEGKDINPHIPQYISSAPWYVSSEGPTLKHQRPQEEKAKQFAGIDQYFERGLKGATSTRYRKGACENCGASTHVKKDCLERPRRVGAKFSGESIASDELLEPELNLDYDGKRDRWSGYNSDMYKVVIDEYEKVEEAKRQLKEEKQKEDLTAAENKDKEQPVDTVESDSDGDEDEKYADHVDMPGTKVDSKQRITVRNLRIREDVAKYLRNLDIDSAYYDPKTRAMRDNPYKSTGKDAEELPYAGENFVRFTGDTLKVSKVQTFAWQAHDKGVDVHLQAEPTKAELLHQQYQVKKDEFKDNAKKGILEKYGGVEHLDAPPRELIFAQTENYVEYSRQGRIIKGAEKPTIRSTYEEDVYINNHTSIWGSFWQDMMWGFKCCHSFVKNSYCTGIAGKEALNVSSDILLLAPDEDEITGQKNDTDVQLKGEKNAEDVSGEKVVIGVENAKEGRVGAELLDENKDMGKRKESTEKKKKKKKKKRKRGKKRSRDSESADSDEESDEDKIKTKRLKEALDAEEKRKLEETDERKRNYNSMYEAKAPTEEEIEAFKLKRTLDEDPMLAYLNK